MLANFCLAGTEGPGLCSYCEKEVTIRWAYQRHERNGITADNVLCGTCDNCGNVAMLAAQAGFRYREAREEAQKQRTTVTLPLEMEDYVSASLSGVGADIGHQALFFRALLLCCLDREDEVAALAREVDHKALHLQNQVRMQINFTEKLKEVFAKVQAASGLQNSSDLMRRLIVLSADHFNERMENELRRLAYAYA